MKATRLLEAPAWLIFAVALGLRVLVMVGLDVPRPVSAELLERGWGGEQVAVAKAIVRGEGISDPFARGTGPTAWCGAVYPVLLAGIIRVFGGTNQAVVFSAALINALFSAGTAVGLLRLGQALGRARLGRLTAWVWALHPGAIYFPLSYVWDTAILAFGVTFFLAFLARAGRRPALQRALRVGGGLGLVALVNASALALAPVALAYWMLRSDLSRTARVWAAFGVGVLLVMSPWLVRNRIQLGTFQPRANLGVELMAGNNDDADGGFRPHLHPWHNLEEFEAYRELGEAAHSKRCQAIFFDWLRENPARFAQLTATRIKLFWLGFDPFEPFPLRSGETRERDWQAWLKWWVYLLDGGLALLGLAVYSDRRGGRIAIGGALLCFPLIYYVVHVMERYRFAIEPVLVFLSVALVLWLLGKLGFVRLGAEEQPLDAKAAR